MEVCPWECECVSVWESVRGVCERTEAYGSVWESMSEDSICARVRVYVRVRLYYDCLYFNTGLPGLIYLPLLLSPTPLPFHHLSSPVSSK